MVGIWPHQGQNLGQLLFLLWFKLMRGFVQVHSPASQLVDHVLPRWVKLAHLEPPEAQLEGEGIAIFEDDLGREEGSWAGAPLQAVASFCLWKGTGKSCMCVNLSLSPVPVPPPELQNPPKPEEGPTPGPEHAATMLALEPASPLNESGRHHIEAQLMDALTQACFSGHCSLTPQQVESILRAVFRAAKLLLVGSRFSLGP